MYRLQVLGSAPDPFVIDRKYVATHDQWNGRPYLTLRVAADLKLTARAD